MRKASLVTAAGCASIALLPATALAKHGDRRHHHRAHRARVHHRTFGDDQRNGIEGQPAATVVSFTNGVLTIMANDGKTASGRVTNATELHCEAAEQAEFEIMTAVAATIGAATTIAAVAATTTATTTMTKPTRCARPPTWYRAPSCRRQSSRSPVQELPGTRSN